MLKNEKEFYIRTGEGFEKSYVPLHGGRGSKLPKSSLHINEWPLTLLPSLRH